MRRKCVQQPLRRALRRVGAANNRFGGGPLPCDEIGNTPERYLPGCLQKCIVGKGLDDVYWW